MIILQLVFENDPKFDWWWGSFLYVVLCSRVLYDKLNRLTNLTLSYILQSTGMKRIKQIVLKIFVSKQFSAGGRLFFDYSTFILCILFWFCICQWHGGVQIHFSIYYNLYQNLDFVYLCQTSGPPSCNIM